MIRTVAEIDALPVGTILKPAEPSLDLWYRHNAGWLLIAHNLHPIAWTWNEGHLPVQLIWTPGAQ